MIACRHARAWILRSRDGALSLDQAFQLEEHLRECAACRALDQRAEALEEALARHSEPRVEQLDVELAIRRVRAACEQRDRDLHLARRRKARLAAAGFLLAAAGSVLAVSTLRQRAHDEGRGLVVGGPSSPTRAVSLPGPRSALDAPDPLEGAGSALPDAATEAGFGPIDLAKLEQARRQVREAFAAAAAAHPLGVEGLPARLAAVDQALAPLKAWPLPRLAERLVADPDPTLAALAVRWLGVHGDRLSAGALAGLLRRSSGDPELRRQAVLGLAELGDAGLEALAPALDEAPLRSLALERLVAAPTAPAVDLVERAMARELQDRQRRGDLLEALASMGDGGLDALLRLAVRGGPAAEQALERLRGTLGARERLTELLKEPARARDTEARLAVAARLGLAAALPPLAKRALERETRAGALAALGVFEGPAALEVLLGLWRAGRVPEDDLTLAVRLQLQRDALAACGLVDDLVRAGDARALHDLRDLLTAVESLDAAPALGRLATSSLVDRDERLWAALALCGLGDPSVDAGLSRALRELGPAEPRLASALALALHSNGGCEVLREALGEKAAESAARLCDLFARRPADKNQAVTLSRAARLLEPWLDLDSPERPRTTP